MKLLLPIEIHVAVCELKATQRRTDPLSQVDSYRTASFKYRCYVVCWNNGAALAGVHPGAAVVFFKQYSK